MAETLTINNDAQPEGLTEEEQSNLELGTEIQDQQEQLLAGKYENAKELEKAYVELQKKLGEDGKDEDKTEAEKEEVLPEESEESSEESTPATALINEASTEYYANDGKLSKETIAKFSEMSSQDIVSAYLELQKSNPQPQQQEAEVVDLSAADINSIQNSVGGQTQYQNMVDWASTNMDNSEVEAFDSIVSSGDPAAVKLAVAGIKAKYDDANGMEGKLLTGKAPKSSRDVFRSQAELVAAMSKPEYDSDPAYRADVIEKLDRSDINF